MRITRVIKSSKSGVDYDRVVELAETIMFNAKASEEQLQKMYAYAVDGKELKKDDMIRNAVKVLSQIVGL